MNKENYTQLIKTIEDNETEIVGTISHKINKFVPDDLKYSDTITIAVNWGIRSWATSSQLGTNIVQFKDDFDLLIRTLSHETFHRIQLQLCPIDSARKSKKTKEFEDIVNYTFPDINDSKFYKTLSYIFLEGSASFVGGMDSSELTIKKQKEGIELLQEIYNSIYKENDLEKIDDLINIGLKSNGPFYVLGYYMTQEIVKHSEPDRAKNLLDEGCLAFFNKYTLIKDNSSSDPTENFHFNKRIAEKTVELYELFNDLKN